jgi:protein SCO1/2
MTLNNLDLVIKNLTKEKKEKFKVFFVSIDPERDSPEIIKDYLSSFENKIYGITGDPKKIFLMSKSWGVLTEKIFTEDGNYLINHSSSIILLKNGKYLNRISHHAGYKDIFKTINKYLR